MNINDFIGEKADERIKKIKEEACPSPTGVKLKDLEWLFQYIEFLRGNRRANQNGLD